MSHSMQPGDATPFLLDSARAAAQQSANMSRVSPIDAGSLNHLQRLEQFQDYALGAGFDEMFDAPGRRASTMPAHRTPRAIDPQELRQRQCCRRRRFLHQGITFTVYGERGAPSASSPSI